MRRGDIPCRQTKGLLELMIGPCPSCLARPRQRRALGHGHRLSSTAVGAQVVMETAQRSSPHIHVPHRVAPPRTHIASPTMSCVSVYLRKLSGRSLGELGYGWPSEAAVVLQLRAPSRLAPSSRSFPICWTKHRTRRRCSAKPWSRGAVGREEGLLLHDHDMEVRHAPEFCFSFPARSGNAWPFRCVARRCIRLRPHALRNSTDGHGHGHGHGAWSMEGAVGCGRS